MQGGARANRRLASYPRVCPFLDKPPLVAGVHVFRGINRKKTWMAGTSPAMTIGGWSVKTIVTALAIAASASAAIAPASAQVLPGGFVFLRDIDPTIIQDIR